MTDQAESDEQRQKTSLAELNERWDKHSERQLSAAKAGTAAVTVLNSGSWIALLTQADKFASVGFALSVAFWGAGAFLGTLIWLFVYRSTILQYQHDFDRENEEIEERLNRNIRFGVTTAIASGACFLAGAAVLTAAVWSSA